jgi:predicted permease
MPDWKSELEKRLAGAHLHPASEGDLIEELSQHLEDRYRELLTCGIEPAAAQAAVLAELENLDKLPASLPPQRRRPDDELLARAAAPSASLIVDLVRDLRFGWRMMLKTPILTSFAVLSLGLGIGANTTVFTIINTLLLHPLPVKEPARLMTLYETGTKGSKQAGSRDALSYANFEDYSRQQDSFSGIAAFTPPVVMALRTDAGPTRMFGEFVTHGYFQTLGLTPAIGRFFEDREDTYRDAAPVAVLSYGAWKSRFGGSPGTVGTKLELNGLVVTVIGVAPHDFIGVSAVFGPDVWIAATMCERAYPVEFAGALSDRAKPLYHAFGRLKPDSTPQRAQAQLETLSAAFEREHPDSNEGRVITVRPITDELFSNVGGSGGITFGSAILFVIVALVLGIACSNVANLLLARAAARRQEIAVRLAIGANRGRLIRQMLTESVLLGVAGCVTGLAIGYAGCRFVWSFVPAEVVQNMLTPRLDSSVLAFALLVALATSFVFGLAPALRAFRTDVVSSLKEETRSGGRTRRTVSLNKLLLVGQVAFSLICLITTALFYRSIKRAYTIDPGFQTRHLALLMINPVQAGHDETRIKDFYRAAHETVSAIPGVASVAWASGLPLWHSASRSIEIEGTPLRKKSDALRTVVLTVDKDYFQTMGIVPVGGRMFRDSDDDGTLEVAIINRVLAREQWPGSNPIGHRFQFGGQKSWRQVIGVVETANYTTLGEGPQPCVYLPLRQNFAEGMVLHVRSTGNPADLLPAIQRRIWSLDRNVEVSDVRTGEKLIGQALWAPTVGVSLLGVFGSLALILASVGLYGVMADAVIQRRREIGVRTALGASPSGVVWLILREGMSLVTCGIVLGLLGGLVAGRVLSRMLFGIGFADPVSLLAAGSVLVAVALLACYLPARSATRIDPMCALRDT